MVDPSSLDSLVKGAPVQPTTPQSKPPLRGTSPVDHSNSNSNSNSNNGGNNGSNSIKPGDPLNHTPSSPSMIYLNMLILEASLRAQYLELRTRRRKHTFFMALLILWVAGFGYALFFAPREDGLGVGGSVYWVVDMTEKVCFGSGVVTALLVWATGIWERGIRWPRRWFGVSNRGLRVFNCKLIIMKRPWWVELMSTLGFFFTYGAFNNTAGHYRYVEPSLLREVEQELSLTHHDHPQMPFLHADEEKGGYEEDLSSGGDYVKLLFLPKPFSANFRENWELYRNGYWERENERRFLLRVKLKQRDKELAKQESKWLWWVSLWFGKKRKSLGPPHGEPEKNTQRRGSALNKRPRSGSVRRGSMSSSSPAVEVEEMMLGRRGSTASNASERRKKKHLATGSRSRREARSPTPEIPSPLAKESSVDNESGVEAGGRAARKNRRQASSTS